MSLIRRAARRALKPVGGGTHQVPPILTSNALLAPGNQWYAPALAGASTFSSAAVDPATVRQALDILQRLTPDAYADYVSAFYRAGLERHGDRWRYADIIPCC
jgi:hypothetical protein